MCGAKPLVTMNIPIVYRFRLCIENICPYLKVLEMLTVYNDINDSETSFMKCVYFVT